MARENRKCSWPCVLQRLFSCWSFHTILPSGLTPWHECAEQYSAEDSRETLRKAAGSLHVFFCFLCSFIASSCLGLPSLTTQLRESSSPICIGLPCQCPGKWSTGILGLTLLCLLCQDCCAHCLLWLASRPGSLWVTVSCVWHLDNLCTPLL